MSINHNYTSFCIFQSSRCERISRLIVINGNRIPAACVVPAVSIIWNCHLLYPRLSPDTISPPCTYVNIKYIYGHTPRTRDVYDLPTSRPSPGWPKGFQSERCQYVWSNVYCLEIVLSLLLIGSARFLLIALRLQRRAYTGIVYSFTRRQKKNKKRVTNDDLIMRNR